MLQQSDRVRIRFAAAFVLGVVAAVGLYFGFVGQPSESGDTPPHDQVALVAAANAAQSARKPSLMAASVSTNGIDREPLKGFVARTAAELGDGEQLRITAVAGMTAKLWPAPTDNAPLILLVPGADTAASAWTPFVVAIAQVMHAHVIAWDAGRLHGRRDAGDVSAVIAVGKARFPKARKIAVIAAGIGFDRVVSGLVDEHGAIVVAVGGRIVSGPATAIWQRGSLPWLFCAVGDIHGESGVTLTTPQPRTLMTKQIAEQSAGPGVISAPARSRLLGWLFALL